MDARLSFDIDRATAGPRPAPGMEDLVRRHARLIQRIAWQVHSRVAAAIAIEDLVQIGQIALIEAAGTFVDRGTASFTTYATLRVRGAMIDELRKSATISRQALRRRREFATARQVLQSQLGRPPSDEEMAGKVDMAVGAYRTAVDATHAIEYSSIDDAYSDFSSWFADSAPGADEVLDGARSRDAIAAAVAQLPEREQTVLQLFFVEECSLAEIGAIFDASASRICQIKRSALEKLRAKLKQYEPA
jgi:RNA polymerase sigma factor for flagellar operon FliA